IPEGILAVPRPVAVDDDGRDRVDLEGRVGVDAAGFETIAPEASANRRCETVILDAACGLRQRQQGCAVAVDKGGPLNVDPISEPAGRRADDIVIPDLEIEESLAQPADLLAIVVAPGGAIHRHR